MAVGLLLSAFAKSYSKEELYLQQKFKERLADLHATVGKIHYRLNGKRKYAKSSRVNERVFLLLLFYCTQAFCMNVPHSRTAFVTGTPIMRAPTPGEGKVPVTLSKVQNIQPATTKSET